VSWIRIRLCFDSVPVIVKLLKKPLHLFTFRFMATLLYKFCPGSGSASTFVSIRFRSTPNSSRNPSTSSPSGSGQLNYINCVSWNRNRGSGFSAVCKPGSGSGSRLFKTISEDWQVLEEASAVRKRAFQPIFRIRDIFGTDPDPAL